MLNNSYINNIYVIQYFIGYIKDRVYQTVPRDIEELKQRIRDEFQRIPQDMIERACRSVPERLEIIVQNNGGHYFKYWNAVSCQAK